MNRIIPISWQEFEKFLLFIGCEFKRKNFKFEDIVKILEHKSYIYQNFEDVKTIWSLGLDMTNQKYKIYWNLQGNSKEENLEV